MCLRARNSWILSSRERTTAISHLCHFLLLPPASITTCFFHSYPTLANKNAQTEAPSDADPRGLQDQSNSRFLHAQSKVHSRNFYRAPFWHNRGIPAPRRYPPVPPRFAQHSVRCRPLSHCSWPAVDRQIPHRDSRSRLCSSFEVRPVAVPVQAAEESRAWSHGYNLQKAKRPARLP